jgi:hypothetical protein
VLDDPAHNHSGQPLAHVAFVKVRSLGYLLAGRGGKARHGVEQAGAVTDARHQRKRPVVEDG